MKTIAILCGGGPAPGINTVVATVTKVFLKDGYRVLAVHEGYKGLFAECPEVEILTYEKAEEIYNRGGSAIKMSRFKPKDEDFNTRLFVKEEIKCWGTRGGEVPEGR
ncbi:MAG: 6-phosphofructokinase, partial [Odoribacter sp.]|nr:6-phosphofructokinase [Odoribacter sp.]